MRVTLEQVRRHNPSAITFYDGLLALLRAIDSSTSPLMNIFENLVHDENTLTELFRNMLRFSVFRRVFLDLLPLPISITAIGFDQISTQVTTTNGRPDLILSTEQTLVYIEIKIRDAYLTDHQPIGYLESLSRSPAKQKALVLLMPTDYKFLPEYRHRLTQWPATNELIPTRIITWTELILAMEAYELAAGNPILAEFTQLLKHWFEPKPILLPPKFHQTMFSSQTPASLEALTELIVQYRDCFSKQFPIEKFKKNILDEYGFYIVLNGELSFFFGVWFDYWKTFGNPICFGIQSDSPETTQLWRECLQKSFAVIEHRWHWQLSNLTEKQATPDMIKETTDQLSHILEDFKARLSLSSMP